MRLRAYITRRARTATLAALEQRLEPRPDPVEQNRLRLGVGMQAVRLHQRLVERDILQDERDQWQLVLTRQVGIHRLKLFRVRPAVIGRHAHSGQHHARAGGA